MPGITGIISRSARPDGGKVVRAMVDSMLHESFYSSGTCDIPELGTHCGWVHHVGSFSDCHPIWNERGDIGLVFSGEHYADPEEAQRLRTAGHQNVTDDASYLVHLYEELGADFFLRLNGTFAGVLIDRRENKVILFNDRFGLGRIYVHEGDNTCFFASEAKALLRILPHLRQIDDRGLGELLVCGCTLQDRTLFKGVSLLPPGARWTFSPGKPALKEQYFDRSVWENQTPLDADEYYPLLRETFGRVLPRYYRGNQKVALSVTGGLDSRMIIANAKPGQLPCYTFGGMYRDSEDVRVGRLVAELCGQSHSVIRVDERFFPRYLELAQKCVYVTDGTMDVSAAVGLYVNRFARNFGDVRMTGNYGSEILRGNVAFKAGRVSTEVFSKPFTSFLAQATSTYRLEREGCNRLSFIAYKQVPWHHYSRLAEENSQLTIRAPYLDNELVQLAYRAPASLLVNKLLAYRYTTDVQPALSGAPTDRGVLSRPRFIPEKLYGLSKELRPKAEYYFDYGMPHWLAKADKLFSPLHLEKLFLGQQKYYHYRIWYRRALAEQIRSVLLDPRSLSRSYLDRKKVESMVIAHTRGTGNYTLEIHKLMSCELIYRSLIEL